MATNIKLNSISKNSELGWPVFFYYMFLSFLNFKLFDIMIDIAFFLVHYCFDKRNI